MKVRNILIGAALMLTAVTAMAEGTYKEIFAKGLKEYKARKYKEAIVTLKEASELAKNAKEKYYSGCYYGYSLNRLRKYDDAIKVFEDLLKVEGLKQGEKDNVLYHCVRNNYYARKTDKVIEFTEKIIADDKVGKRTKTLVANLACSSKSRDKKYKEAEKWAIKMQELDPKNHSAVIFQAQALRGQRKFEEALKVVNKDIIPEMNQKNQGNARLERSRLLSALKKHGEALVEVTAVYELDKVHQNIKDVAILYAIERFNIDGKLEGVDIWVERIDLMKHKYYKGRATLRYGQILQKQGKLEEAKKKLEESKKLHKSFKREANKHIAQIDKKLGK